MAQKEFSLIGPATPGRYEHPDSEVRICRDMSDAVYISMRHAQMTQEVLAERIHVSPGYLSLMLNRKRPWQHKHLQRVRHTTGSMATLQFAAMQEGMDLYVDPVKARLAQLEQEKQELLRRAA